MRITYDAVANAAYVHLSGGETPPAVAHTYACDPVGVQGQINLDFDGAGRLVGIEVLGARTKLPAVLLSQAEASAPALPGAR